MEILLEWTGLILVLEVALTLTVALHVVLNKRDPRAALAWIAIVGFIPLLGAFLYYLVGINRITRRARRLRRRPRRPKPLANALGDLPSGAAPALPTEIGYLSPLVRLVDRVTDLPLQSGNSVQPLHEGDQAYPEMLQAIEDAKSSVAVCMYIFTHDEVGLQFVSALARAVARGVAVRVLVDGVGAHFSWRSIVGALRDANVPVARFLPTWFPRHFAYANLRNHRKLMIVDGRVGFTGGMNITGNCWHARQPKHPIHDLQFRLRGPIVARMQEVFSEDWKFATGESLTGHCWFPPVEPAGKLLARGIASGPDEDIEKVRLVMLGAIASARSSIRIVTPYFLPDAGLVSALTIASLRGVQVDILLPRQNDQLLVQWACAAQLGPVLEHGCRVWLVSPPFRHTKLMLVDRAWTLLGSANWDPRSLRLNFEFNVECYDPHLAGNLEKHLESDLVQAERLTLAKWNQRRLPIRLRDGIAALMSPLL